MATKKAQPTQVGTLQASIAELTAKRDTLDERRTSLQATIDNGVSLDVDTELARIQGESNELAAVDRVLAALDAQLVTLRAELDAAQKAERQAAIDALRAQELAAAREVTAIAEKLAAALAELRNVETDLRRHNGVDGRIIFPNGYVIGDLDRVLEVTLAAAKRRETPRPNWVEQHAAQAAAQAARVAKRIARTA